MGLLVYVQVCDSEGRPLLVPCPLFHPIAATPSAAACSLRMRFPIGGDIVVAWHPERGVLTEPGLMLSEVGPDHCIPAGSFSCATQLLALQGYTGDPRTSWRALDRICVKPTQNVIEQTRQWLAAPESILTHGDRQRFEEHIQAVEQFTLIDALREMDQDMPPEGERRFIATPRRGIEEELVELLILEELAKEATGDDSDDVPSADQRERQQHAQLLLDHLVAETGTGSTAGLLSAHRWSRC